VALGRFGWDVAFSTMTVFGHAVSPKPRFGHRAEAPVGPWILLGSYHPSQQNTFTGRLTSAMLVDVLRRARELARGDLRPA